ncbi:MAG: LysR family transcriptional regulator [Pseudomonadota bacterium]
MNSDIDISKIRKLDGGLLLVFAQLLEHGNVSKAARALHLGQSTVSHALSRLREVFEDPLFVRRSHGLEPTARALQLRPGIEALLDLTRETLGIGQAFDPAVSGRIFALSAPEFVTLTMATALLERLASAAPKVGVTFAHMAEREMVDALRRGEVDAAIGRYDGALPGVTLEPLYDDTFCVACRRGHPIARGRLTEKKYRSARHIWANSPSETVPQDADFDYTSFQGSIVPRWQTALAIAARTDHVATCPRRLAESQADLLDIHVLPLPGVHGLKVSLAYRSDLQDKGIEWFLAQIRAGF